MLFHSPFHKFCYNFLQSNDEQIHYSYNLFYNIVGNFIFTVGTWYCYYCTYKKSLHRLKCACLQPLVWRVKIGPLCSLAIFPFCYCKVKSDGLQSSICSTYGTAIFQYLMHVKHDSTLFHHDKMLMHNIILLTFTNYLERKVYAVLLNSAKTILLLLLLQQSIIIVRQHIFHRAVCICL